MLIRHQIRTIFSSKIPGSKKLVLLYKATIIKNSSFIMSLALISSYLQIISSSGKSHFLFSCFCQSLFGTFLFLPTFLPYFFPSLTHLILWVNCIISWAVRITIMLLSLRYRSLLFFFVDGSKTFGLSIVWKKRKGFFFRIGEEINAKKRSLILNVIWERIVNELEWIHFTNPPLASLLSHCFILSLCLFSSSLWVFLFLLIITSFFVDTIKHWVVSTVKQTEQVMKQYFKYGMMKWKRIELYEKRKERVSRKQWEKEI